LFTYDTLLSKQVGCPLVKVYGYSPIKKGIPTSAEINFLSDTLSKNELKIFDAWEKNEKKTP
jgi:hypothetical protein